MTFPPPNADQQINPLPSPSPSTAPPGRSPRRTASIVALTSGLLVGGVLVGSQFVSANTPSVGDDTTEPKTDDTIEPDADDTADLDKADWMDSRRELYGFKCHNLRTARGLGSGVRSLAGDFYRKLFGS